jgi:hypothetical protein
VCVQLGDAAVDWRLPPPRWGAQWRTVLDTSSAHEPEARRHDADATLHVMGRSVVVLEQVDPGDD